MGGRDIRKRRFKRLLQKNSNLPSRRSSPTSLPSSKHAIVKKRRPPRVYCICRKTYRGQFMIQCETCLEWYHGTCIQLTFEQSKYINAYYCTSCITSATNRSPQNLLILSPPSSSISVATITAVSTSISRECSQKNVLSPDEFDSSLILNIDGFLSILHHIHDLDDLSTMALVCKRWRLFVKSYVSVSARLMNLNNHKAFNMTIDFVDFI